MEHMQGALINLNVSMAIVQASYRMTEQMAQILRGKKSLEEDQKPKDQSPLTTRRRVSSPTGQEARSKDQSCHAFSGMTPQCQPETTGVQIWLKLQP